MASRRSLATGTVASLVLVGAVVALIFQIRGPRGFVAPSQEWFYDLNTEQLFAVPLGTLPPAAAPSGSLPDGSPAGVRAYVYSCGNCDAAGRFIAYLETYTSDARRRFEAVVRHGTSAATMPADPNTPVELPDQPENMTGVLVRAPGDTNWVERASGPGQLCVSSGLANRCPPSVFARRCYPH